MNATGLVGFYRIALSLLIAAAIIATLADTLSRGPVNVFNFFGYFTIQSNIFLMVVLLIAGSLDLRGSRHPAWLDLLRGLATTYIVIVGIVYAVLLAPLAEAGGVPVPWANVVLHIVTPIAGAVVWLVVADRRVLPWQRLPVVLAYPLVWLVAVLIRGATDGWVPYPFLDPANGYGSVAFVCLFICVAMVVIGALVFLASRWRLVELRPASI